MDLHLSLINGRQRDEAVKRVADHLETMCWPSVLSSTLEDLLILQMLTTVDEVTALIVDHQVSLEQIIADVEPLRAGQKNGRALALNDSLSTKSPILALVS
jgi:hypothetical protein